ncbi:PASTA domain-containing protein [Tsukamurella sp. NPDC003166]|uniref:PASTA domain-containing protein n=1 Tax=Tsukamurella sp. NPDC003166 TaxID=3154444 RepID=UPI0033A8374F
MSDADRRAGADGFRARRRTQDPAPAARPPVPPQQPSVWSAPVPPPAPPRPVHPHSQPLQHPQQQAPVPRTHPLPPAPPPPTPSTPVLRADSPAAVTVEPPEPGADDATSGRSRRRKRRRYRVLAVALLVVALLVGGAAGGYYLQNEVSARRTSPDPAVVTVPQAAAGGGEVRMLDVRGMDEQVARQALIDQGVSADVISVRTEPAAGSPGRVVSQTPAASTQNPQKVELTISAEARMPVVLATDGQQTSVTLQKLGAQVTMVSRYQPGARPGDVIASVPAAGAVLPQDVSLTVAEAGSTVLMSSQRLVRGSCDSGSYSLNGKDFPKSTACGVSTDPELYEWVTKRAVDEVVATVGIADRADTDGEARVEVLADGRSVAVVTARYGATENLVAPVTGALRVALRITRIKGKSTVYPVFGDGQFRGSADIAQKLAAN